MPGSLEPLRWKAYLLLEIKRWTACLPPVMESVPTPDMKCIPVLTEPHFIIFIWKNRGSFPWVPGTKSQAFTRLGHEYQDLLSPCNGMHACTDWTLVYTLIKGDQPVQLQWSPNLILRSTCPAAVVTKPNTEANLSSCSGHQTQYYLRSTCPAAVVTKPNTEFNLSSCSGHQT